MRKKTKLVKTQVTVNEERIEIYAANQIDSETALIIGQYALTGVHGKEEIIMAGCMSLDFFDGAPVVIKRKSKKVIVVKTGGKYVSNS